MTSAPDQPPSAIPRSPIPALRVSQALSLAFQDTRSLLFQPFRLRLWLWLSFVCLFLGGGTASAAFNWSLGSLPGEIGFQQAAERVQNYVAARLWLVGLALPLGLAMVIAFLYLRATMRFVLVDAILNRETRVREAWAASRALGWSYFKWLTAGLLTVGLGLTLLALAVFPYLRTLAARGTHSARFWLEIVIILVIDVLAGLALALAITLTDDFVVPLMYASQWPMRLAWAKLWRSLRREPLAYGVYILARFVVAMALSVIVIFVLFPFLLLVFSAAIVTAVLAVLALRLTGLTWVWNPVTLVAASAGLGILLTAVLILLSVGGMPEQVFLQSFGIRFIGLRFESLRSLLPNETSRNEGSFEENLRNLGVALNDIPRGDGP